MSDYIIIEKDLFFQKMSIAEKTVKKYGIVVSDENPFLKHILAKWCPDSDWEEVYNRRVLGKFSHKKSPAIKPGK